MKSFAFGAPLARMILRACCAQFAAQLLLAVALAGAASADTSLLSLTLQSVPHGARQPCLTLAMPLHVPLCSSATDSPQIKPTSKFEISSATAFDPSRAAVDITSI